MVAYSTLGKLYIKIETILFNIIKLRSLPSINSYSNKFEYEILKDKKIIKRKLEKQASDLIDLNKMKNNYYYEVIDNIIYFVYNVCKEEYDGQMLELVNKLKSVSIKHNIKNFIIDLRGNMGGNSNCIKPLIEFLKDKKVVTLVNNYVFSSGGFAIVDLKSIGSIFVGTNIGTTLNHFGDVKRIKLDNYILPISTKYFYYDDKTISMKEIDNKNDFIHFKNDSNNQMYFEPQIFKPDYYVESSIEDYQNNRDRQLELAIELLNNIKKKEV